MASVENGLLVELVDSDVEHFRKKLLEALKYELPQDYLKFESMVDVSVKRFTEKLEDMRNKNKEQMKKI